jgi:hypothetical protein
LSQKKYYGGSQRESEVCPVKKIGHRTIADRPSAGVKPSKPFQELPNEPTDAASKGLNEANKYGTHFGGG